MFVTEMIASAREMIASEVNKTATSMEKVACLVQMIATLTGKIATFIEKTATSIEKTATSTEKTAKIGYPCKSLKTNGLKWSSNNYLRHKKDCYIRKDNLPRNGTDHLGVSDNFLRAGSNLLRDKLYLHCDQENHVQRIDNQERSEHDRLRRTVDLGRHIIHCLPFF